MFVRNTHNTKETQPRERFGGKKEATQLIKVSGKKFQSQFSFYRELARLCYYHHIYLPSDATGLDREKSDGF